MSHRMVRLTPTTPVHCTTPEGTDGTLDSVLVPLRYADRVQLHSDGTLQMHEGANTEHVPIVRCYTAQPAQTQRYDERELVTGELLPV